VAVSFISGGNQSALRKHRTVASHWQQDYNLEDIQRIVKSNDKQRFFMEEDKETGKMKIRANQGHSLQVKLLY
jgi:RNA:NAD 2'-phosphotransferase (TPT1/KptA family)